MGTGAAIAAQVTAIDTVHVVLRASRGLKEAAEADPALADLADVVPMLAPPEPPRVVVVAEYAVSVSVGEAGQTAARLSSMDLS